MNKSLKQDPAKRLTEFLDEIISIYGKRTIDSYELSLGALDEDEQGEFAYLLLEANPNFIDDAFSPVSNSILDEMNAGLKAVLRNNDSESKIDLSETFFKNAIEYLKGSMQSLLTHRCDELHENMMEDHGFHKKQCEQTGEWRYA